MKPSLREKIERLSLTKLEFICQLNFNGDEEGKAEAREEQKEIVAYLADLYEHGGERAAPDPLKAAKYRAQLRGESPSFLSWLKGPNSVYTASSWFNWLRLTGLQVMMVLEYFLKKTVVPRLYGIGGVLYIADAVFDLVDIFLSTIRPAKTEEEKNLGFWKLRWRLLKNAFNEEGRLAHLANCIVWGPINAIGFFLTGGFTTWLTLAGFGWDGASEVGKGGKDVYDHKTLLDEYRNELKEKRAELENLLRSENSGQDESLRQQKIAEYRTDIKKLEVYETQLQESLSYTKKMRTFAIVSTFITLVGIGLLIFPPTTLPTLAVSIGVGLVITGLTLNLGQKLYEAYKFFNPNNAAPPAPSKEVNKEHEDDKPFDHDLDPSNSYNNSLGQLLGRNPNPEAQPLLSDNQYASSVEPFGNAQPTANLPDKEEIKKAETLLDLVLPNASTVSQSADGNKLQTQTNLTLFPSAIRPQQPTPGKEESVKEQTRPEENQGCAQNTVAIDEKKLETQTQGTFFSQTSEQPPEPVPTVSNNEPVREQTFTRKAANA